MFNANHLVNQFPTEGRPITEFNIPSDVKSINAAFVWGYNTRTYLVSGDMYWKMNENNTFVEYDYPRDMGTWKGVPVPLDAAFKDLTGGLISEHLICFVTKTSLIHRKTVCCKQSLFLFL